MKKETLSEAIGRVDDVLIETAAQPAAKRERKPISWKRWAGLAACLALVVVVIAVFPRMGGNSAEPGVPADPGASPGDGGYHNYTGPILPLTALSGAELLGETERELVLDFEQGNGGSLTVTDRYTLHNPTQEDVTVEVLYPFITTLRELNETQPTLSVEGQAVNAQVLAGGYAGGFRGAGGGEEDLNLRQPERFEDYAALLADGSYLTRALEGVEDLSGITVTVYKFTDFWGPEESDDIPNPTLRATFSLDYSKTTVLSYGFNGGTNDSDGGTMGRDFSVHYADAPCYLIILGDDITNLETQGYATGGYSTTRKIDAGANIRRYECSLDEALREVFAIIEEIWVSQGTWPADLGEMPYQMFCDYLMSYGLLSENVKTRYEFGMLEDFDFSVTDRVFYLKTEVTVPAGGELGLVSVMNKPGSHNYDYGREDRRYGYEIASGLGTSLEISKQYVTFVNMEGLEIVSQNLNYDFAGSVKAVEQDTGVDRYYFDVKEIES